MYANNDDRDAMTHSMYPKCVMKLEDDRHMDICVTNSHVPRTHIIEPLLDVSYMHQHIYTMLNTLISLDTSIYIYTLYIYTFVCVCMCVWVYMENLQK